MEDTRTVVDSSGVDEESTAWAEELFEDVRREDRLRNNLRSFGTIGFDAYAEWVLEQDARSVPMGEPVDVDTCLHSSWV